MLRKVLFANDGSDAAEHAREVLSLLPLPAACEIEVLSIVDPAVGRMMIAVRPEHEDWITHVNENAVAALQHEGVTITSTVRSGDPAHQIIARAREIRADLIVVGSTGLNNVEAFLLGSVSRNVAKHAPCPVLVGRAPRFGLNQVIVATDGSDHGLEAVDFTARLPLPVNTRVTAVNVVRLCEPTPDLVTMGDFNAYEMVDEANESLRETAQTLVETARVRLRAGGKTAETAVREGDPAAEILALSRDLGADLIVAGARGCSPIEALLVGSVADRLVHHARGSVLLVR